MKDRSRDSYEGHWQQIKPVLGHLWFMWQRGRLASAPYVPTESVPEHNADWYTEAERDRLLDGIFAMYPQ